MIGLLSLCKFLITEFYEYDKRKWYLNGNARINLHEKTFISNKKLSSCLYREHDVMHKRNFLYLEY